MTWTGRIIFGMLFIAFGILQIWARNAFSETYSLMLKRRAYPFPPMRYTPRASVIAGCGMIIIGLLVLLGL